jgi:hypothetical protein
MYSRYDFLIEAEPSKMAMPLDQSLWDDLHVTSHFYRTLNTTSLLSVLNSVTDVAHLDFAGCWYLW